MGLRPFIDISAVRRIAGHPSLRDAVMGVGPLRDNVRIAAGLVRLEPSLDIGRDKLTLLVACGIGGDRADHARDAVAQRIIGGGVG